jgi:glycosyltransferase involved in cell wall biosynthesis
MNLSVLITNHNYDCTLLLKQLYDQLVLHKLSWELIVVDDCSPQNEILENNQITAKELNGCKYIVNDKNEGAAVCRNKLTQIAQGDYLIFIDGDASVGDNKHFIDNYWEYRNKADIVVGGLVHPEFNVDSNRTLRFKYEKEADKHRSADERSCNPYDKFTAFNIMSKKCVFDIIHFDESCKEYGYEDALFGMELKDKCISVFHIDNPLIHTGLDTNERFLHKTDLSLKTLINLQSMGKMLSGSKIRDMALKIERLKMQKTYHTIFKVFEKNIIRNLQSKNPSLFLFSIYKLGRYFQLKETIVANK